MPRLPGEYDSGYQLQPGAVQRGGAAGFRRRGAGILRRTGAGSGYSPVWRREYGSTVGYIRRGEGNRGADNGSTAEEPADERKRKM